MTHHDTSSPDFGTGHKKLSIYTLGMVICVVLTIIAFYAVMSELFPRIITIAIIFAAAVTQFLVQIIFFLRLNVRTEQGVVNVFAFIYTLVILLCIVAGSLWIMANMNYYMMN